MCGAKCKEQGVSGKCDGNGDCIPWFEEPMCGKFNIIVDLLDYFDRQNLLLSATLDQLLFSNRL